MIGKDIRIERIINRNTGRAVIVPMDHGFSMGQIEGLLDFLLPHYIAEGKSYLGIGIGCTGGNHRSVVLAEKINEYLNLKGYSSKLFHKDIGRSNE